ncbi:hypothetical protein As57867_003186, partial [Aphanomyces stellatus]
MFVPRCFIAALAALSIVASRRCTPESLSATSPYYDNCTAVAGALVDADDKSLLCFFPACRLYIRSFALLNCTSTDGADMSNAAQYCEKNSPQLFEPKQEQQAASTAPPTTALPALTTTLCAHDALPKLLGPAAASTIPSRCSLNATNGNGTFDVWTIKTVDCTDPDCLDVLNRLQLSTLASPSTDCAVQVKSANQTRWFLGNLVAYCSMQMQVPPSTTKPVNNAATIVGASIGGVVALALICFFVWRRRHTRTDDYSSMT